MGRARQTAKLKNKQKRWICIEYGESMQHVVITFSKKPRMDAIEFVDPSTSKELFLKLFERRSGSEVSEYTVFVEETASTTTIEFEIDDELLCFGPCEPFVVMCRPGTSPECGKGKGKERGLSCIE